MATDQDELSKVLENIDLDSDAEIEIIIEKDISEPAVISKDLTLFWMGFLMYAKRMGAGGKTTPPPLPPTLTFEPKVLQSKFFAWKFLQQCTFQKKN